MSDREVDQGFVREIDISPADAAVAADRKRRRIFAMQRKSDLLKQLEDIDKEIESLSQK